MESKPLTPITDEDFFINHSDGWSDSVLSSPKYLQERGLKSEIQCPRLDSLFRKEYLDGTIEYYDMERVHCFKIEDEHKTVWHNGFVSHLITEMFPITMPYTGDDMYDVYVDEFLTDKNNGAFDTMCVLYVKKRGTSDIININRYFKVTEESWEEISEEEYNQRKELSMEGNI